MLGLANPYSSTEIDTLLDKLESRYKNTKTIKGDFVQTTTKAMQQGLKVEERGHFYFRMPGKMRWEYKTGRQKIILSDGNALWMLNINKDTSQAVKISLKGDLITKTPMAFLLGIGSLRTYFTIKKIDGDDPSKKLVLEFLPKESDDTHYKKMFISLEPKTLEIKEIIMMDFFGNKTKLRFLNVKWNDPLNNQLFIFNPSKNINVTER